ncbi:MAG: hypothetical protein ACREBU_21580 [Nitrososphaera sp.]
MKYPNITMGRVKAVWNKLGGEDGVERFLRGEPIVADVQSDLIQVDRSIRPVYPDWVKEILHLVPH